MTLAILQARSNSKRLPGKVLMPIMNKPMILHQINRISHCTQISNLVVATSDEKSDDMLADVLTSQNIEVFRGPLENVFDRFQKTLDKYHSEDFVRLTADCPLTDPSLIDKAIVERRKGNFDYYSNSLSRTYPHGLDVEAVLTEAFLRTRDWDITSYQREHVTPVFYENPDKFSIGQMLNTTDQSSLRWTVDFMEDFDFVRSVYEKFSHLEFFTSQDILAIGKNEN